MNSTQRRRSAGRVIGKVIPSSGPPLRVRATRSAVMTITKTMTLPIAAAMKKATGVCAETAVLTPFHSVRHALHRSSEIGGMHRMPWLPTRRVFILQDRKRLGVGEGVPPGGVPFRRPLPALTEFPGRRLRSTRRGPGSVAVGRFRDLIAEYHAPRYRRSPAPGSPHGQDSC